VLLKPWFALLLASAVGLAAVGCGDDSGSTGSTSSSSGTGGSGGSGGGSGGSGGGTGGSGGGEVVDQGKPGASFVNAGSRVKSSKYVMDFSLGQSSPVQQPITSPKYRLNGGLIGATGNK